MLKRKGVKQRFLTVCQKLLQFGDTTRLVERLPNVFPPQIKTSLMVPTYSPVLGRQRREGQKFKVFLSAVASLRAAWAAGVPVSKRIKKLEMLRKFLI